MSHTNHHHTSVGADAVTAAAAPSGRLRAWWNTAVGALGTLGGLAPHVLHHVGPLAGTALVAGAGGTALFGALDTLPVPLVGRIQGAALGGGSGLAAVCDVVVAADDAVFGFTEVRLGILPAVIGPFVAAKIGVSAARALFLTGGRFPAALAHRLGLVHEVVPAAELDAVVDTVVRDLLLGAPSAQRRVKALLRDIVDRPPADVRPLTSAALADQRVSADGQDGLAAFLAKRPARWVIEP